MKSLIKKVSLISKIPAFQFGRVLGSGILFPVNLTISLLYSCNSRCKTCNVYLKKVDNLSLLEYDRIFQSLGRAPFWFTFSGGEPFLRKDIAEIVKVAYRRCHPAIINIPTNGSLYRRIPGLVEDILQNCTNSELIINISLDHVKEKHDRIRGLKNNFEKAMRTYRALKEFRKYSNFTLGIHTVISNFNVDEFQEVYKELIVLEPDSYITEIAEERVELGTVGSNITPPIGKYEEAIDFLKSQMLQKKRKGIAQIAQAFRYEYYDLVKQILTQQTQVIPCFAGIMSAQISPDGEVWPCCIRGDSMGNLRDHDYDFKKVWRSASAYEIRQSIRNKECYCPLANASYTNMLASPRSIGKVIRNLKKLSGKVSNQIKK